MNRHCLRPLLAVSIMLAAVLATQPAAAQQHDANCKPLPPGEERIDLEIAKGWLPIGIGLAIADKVCAGKNYLKKLFSSEPDPDKVTPTQVFDAARPDVPPAISSQERYRPANEAAAKLKARAESEKRAFINAADEAAVESEQRDAELRANGQIPRYGPNPAPVTQPGYVAAPTYTTLPPLDPNDFITVFQSTNPAGDPPANLDSPAQIDGEGTLLSEDGMKSGQFVDGKLDGEGQEITADGKWRGGTYVDGGLEGPGFEVYQQDGQVLAVEAEFLDDVPDGMTRVMLADGSTRIDLWSNGQRVAIGKVVPRGTEPTSPVYKTPEQLAAEEEERFQKSLDTAAGPATLYALADELSEKGESARARQALRKILTRFPDSPFALRASDKLDGGSRLAGSSTAAPPAGKSSPAPRPGDGAAASSAGSPAVPRSGEWLGQSSGNRVTLDVRWGGVMVAAVTQNAGQAGTPMMFENGPNGTYRYTFPDGTAAVIQMLGPDQFRITNPDGWTDIFKLTHATAQSAATASPPPQATPPASGCVGSAEYCWGKLHNCSPSKAAGCWPPPGWTGSNLMLPRRSVPVRNRAALMMVGKA